MKKKNNLGEINPAILSATLGLDIRLFRDGQCKLSPQEVEKFVEDTLRHFLVSLKAPAGVKHDFEKFCEGAPLCKTLKMDRSAPIYGISSDPSDRHQPGDDNGQPKTGNPSRFPQMKNQCTDRKVHSLASLY
jgi:hypothetical protein